MYEYWRKNESKSLVLALLAILKNIYEFWRKIELKSLILALGFKKYV